MESRLTWLSGTGRLPLEPGGGFYGSVDENDASSLGGDLLGLELLDTTSIGHFEPCWLESWPRVAEIHHRGAVLSLWA